MMYSTIILLWLKEVSSKRISFVPQIISSVVEHTHWCYKYLLRAINFYFD